jgi:phytoene synthase
MRLAWWREALGSLDSGLPPDEPILQSLARDVLPAGISGLELSRMTEGWEALVGPEPPSPDELATYARLRGGALFELSARLLGSPAIDWVGRTGEGWALVDLGRRSSAASERQSAFAVAAERLGSASRHWPRRLRSLGMLVALAQRDVARGPDRIEAAGVPPRALRMHWHRLTGF